MTHIFRTVSYLSIAEMDDFQYIGEAIMKLWSDVTTLTIAASFENMGKIRHNDINVEQLYANEINQFNLTFDKVHDDVFESLLDRAQDGKGISRVGWRFDSCNSALERQWIPMSDVSACHAMHVMMGKPINIRTNNGIQEAEI